MGRIIALLLLDIFAFTFSILALFVFPEATLPLIQPLVCGPSQTLETNLVSQSSGADASVTFYCQSERRTVTDVTLPVLAVAFVPGIFFSGLLVVALIGSAAERSRILRTGETGVGRVTSVTWTGVRVNNRPVYRIEMDVFTLERAPYRAKANKRSGYYGIAGPEFAPGSLLPLKIDPRNPENVVIEDNVQPDPLLAQKAGGGAAANRGGMPVGAAVAFDMVNDILNQFSQEAATGAGGDLSERLRQLKDAYDNGLITAQEYEAQRQRLLNGL